MIKLCVVYTLFSVMIMGCGRTHYEYFQGQKGDQGEQGQAGTNGTDGQDGSNGQNGVDATPVTVVKLCPGTTVYPSTFVEIAFCIDSKLYATYSTHGGFSTELPPGDYKSNTLGSKCDFTVVSGCEIQN